MEEIIMITDETENIFVNYVKNTKDKTNLVYI